MSKIGKQKLEHFLSDLSSKKPTPGGGAAAGFSGAMAAGLVEMVVELTVTKKGYKKVWKRAKSLGKKAERLQKELLRLSDEDIRAYDAVVASLKTKNKTRVKQALKRAADVPNRIARASGKVSSLAKEAAKIGNKNAYSDARTAVYLASAARLSALENVKINKRVLARLK